MKRQGLVVARTNISYEVYTQDGDTLLCHARTKSLSAVCGDIVEVSSDTQGCVITNIHERKNCIRRIDNFKRTKTLAANIDQVCIVLATAPVYDARAVDEYLAYIENIGAKACIILNKADTLSDKAEYLNTLEKIYSGLSYPLIITSAHTGHGIDKLSQRLKNQSSILAGQSGVGKSSLINALLPEQPAKTAELSAAIDQGTHTTTQARSYPLPVGGRLIDSPGIRRFTPVFSDIEKIQHGFIEISKISGNCRFHNCRHINEPGCAIKEAMENGQIHASRYASYRDLCEKWVATVQ